jgi:hypothetical protein
MAKFLKAPNQSLQPTLRSFARASLRFSVGLNWYTRYG